MRRLLIVDDDYGTMMLLSTIFEKTGYSVESTSNPKKALEMIDSTAYNLVLSDYYMPELNGNELLAQVRAKNNLVPFIFITGNLDIQIATDLVKSGAEDYIIKPFYNDDVLHRVNKVLENIEQKQKLKLFQEENELYERENKKLINWRIMYGNKRIRQMEQMIQLLSRNVNQTGGFMWVDILKDSIEPIEDGKIKVSSDIIDMVLTAAEGQKKVFDYLNFVGTLDSLEIDFNRYQADDFFTSLKQYIEAELNPLVKHHNRELIIESFDQKLFTKVRADIHWYKKVLRELIINGIKYSPVKSIIRIGLSENISLSQPCWDLCIINNPVTLNMNDANGNPIIGIPYDYSELVFDLFFTIENHPQTLPEEDWSEGSGLYVCRQLLEKMGAAIQARNGIHYKTNAAEPFVKVTITIPSES